MEQRIAPPVDPTNAPQAGAWDGEEGAYWAAHADHFDRALAAYHQRLLAGAGIATGDLVLDVGCGTGQTTRDAARAARDGSALGIDLSARMIEVARQLAADQGLSNVAFEQGDAQIHPFAAGAFDAVISRTGTMFFGDPTCAFTNLARALRPGGRLTMLVWQGPDHNEWIRELSGALAAGRVLPAPPIGAPGPFAQADAEAARSVLTAAGFSGVEVEGLSAPMWFGRDVTDAQAFVAGLMGWMLEGLDIGGRRLARENLDRALAAHDTGGGVFFDSSTWLIGATRATRPRSSYGPRSQLTGSAGV
jgi:SAM-dependent methyltransferase